MSNRPQTPQVLEEIAEVAGWEAAWALVRAKGGTKIFLPKSAGRKHWLTAIVGYEAANAICRHYRSNHTMAVVIPLAKTSQWTERWRETIEAGGSINEQAQTMQAHVSTVSRWRAKLPGPHRKRQGDLF